MQLAIKGRRLPLDRKSGILALVVTFGAVLSTAWLGVLAWMAYLAAQSAIALLPALVHGLVLLFG